MVIGLVRRVVLLIGMRRVLISLVFRGIMRLVMNRGRLIGVALCVLVSRRLSNRLIIFRFEFRLRRIMILVFIVMLLILRRLLMWWYLLVV